MRRITIALVCAGVLAIGILFASLMHAMSVSERDVARAARRLEARFASLARTSSFSAARAEAAPDLQPAAARPVRQPVTDPVVNSANGLAAGWLDFGYSRHTMRKGSVVEVDFAGYGGLILSHPGSMGPFGGLSFKYRAPAEFGDFLEVQLQSMSGEALARVSVKRTDAAKLPNGFLDVWLPMEALNPKGQRFERIMFFAHSNVGHDTVTIDEVGFTGVPPEPARRASFVLDCGARPQPISPLIYGVSSSSPWAMGVTARRWGGNTTSRYNWRLNTWNLTKDWFFKNTGDPRSSGYEQFLDENRLHGVKSALTVPTLGWVAKDSSSYSFPVSVFGPQQATASDAPDAGNGVGRDGKPIPPGPPTRTSVPSPPDSIEQLVRQIREKDRTRGRSVDSYILDNEPMLWNATHRDVHPEPTTYDELLEKTIAYASAVRRADPEARIAGPAEWGWLAYQYSAKDMAFGVQLRPDRRLHGDEPLIPWYLRKIREYEQRTGTRILDILDVHFYPMGQGIGIYTAGDTDPATAALRIRSTRSLWDPSYKDESWINERMRVLPLLRQWIAENHPGLGISIGEWNFGAETHMSGGLATAEVLGRFGTEGVTSAYYWTSPPDRSPSFWAFRAFRNFDGAGGHFLDWSVPVKGDVTLASLFGSSDMDHHHVVAVLLNFAALSSLSAHVALEGCGPAVAARGFTYAGGAAGFKTLEVSSTGQAVETEVAPYSITVLDLTAGSSPR
jgi:hypothetical protein